jgi:hypothetical protein
MSRDPDARERGDPKSLHKYLYVGGDPVKQNIDLTMCAGLWDAGSTEFQR